MTETKSSYRQVFKTTSIFGGVQVFNIIIGLIRTKIVAMLLGPSGYGFIGLLNAPLEFITNLTGLGIGVSAVRDISAANETGDQVKLSTTLKTFRRWVWFTGFLGMFVVILLSPWLSELSFGSKDYTWAFLLVSVSLLINAISGGQSTVLRGMRRIKDTAQAGMWGSALGLVVTVPLYYLYGMKGIIPALILSALVTLYLSWHFSRKIKTIPVELSYKESFTLGKAMVKLGFIMSLAGLVSNGVSYLVITFIGKTGGVSEVGLYNSGWSITNQYVGLVFAAMAADYFPRLAGVHTNNLKIKEMVNQQAEMAILIIAPIMLLYLSSLPILIPLLYTKEFFPIIPFTQWVVLGMLFKAASWTMGFVILAKGETKLFFWIEVLFYSLLLCCNIGGYYLFGLEGIGISFLILYINHFIVLLVVCRKKYDFNFTKSFLKIFIVQLIFCAIAFLMAYFFQYPIAYVSGGILFAISVFYSYKELNNRIGIKEFIQSKIGKK